MKNKILSAIISIVLMISLVGCQQNNTIIKPYVEKKGHGKQPIRFSNLYI